MATTARQWWSGGGSDAAELLSEVLGTQIEGRSHETLAGDLMAP
jgi:hypothetical protein